MTCKDVKDFVTEYAKVADEVKAICTDRACTLDTIQKSLAAKDVEISEADLLAVIAQIKEMIVLSNEYRYDVGDVVTYKRYWIWGRIARDEKIGNMIIHVEYKEFYLYNEKMFDNDAFREHILSKLEFEELGRTVINSSADLQKALDILRLEKDKWANYVYVDDKEQVYCNEWNKSLGCSTREHLGKLIRRDPVK